MRATSSIRALGWLVGVTVLGATGAGCSEATGPAGATPLPSPTVKVTPGAASAAGGAQVVVDVGVPLPASLAGVDVLVDGVRVEAEPTHSATLAAFLLPPNRHGNLSEAVTITARLPDGRTGSAELRYVAEEPRLSAVSPAAISRGGGAQLVIDGAGFVPGMEVTVAGSPARDVVVVSATRLSCFAPAGPVGVARVAVRHPEGLTGALAGGIEYTNATPAPADQAVDVNEGTPCAIQLAGVDRDGDPLSYAVLTGPTRGTLSGTPPALIYTPEGDWWGEDAFTFTVSDGLAAGPAGQVRLTVFPVADAPLALPGSATLAEDGKATIGLVGADVDGDPVTFAIVAGPQHGELVGIPPELVYVPDADYAGDDSFRFSVSDGQLSSAPATFTLTVTPVADAPVAVARALSVAEDTPLAVSLTGTDGDGDALTYLVVDGPKHGTLSGTAPDLTYTPGADFHGSDSFSFAASDGGLASAPATVSITVQAVNDAPLAAAQAVELNEDGALLITLTGKDVDGDALSYAVVAGPARGALSGNGNELTYTPLADYHGGDSFTFTVSDGSLTSEAATVAITVQAVNDAPVATAQAVSVSEDGSVSITLAGSDVDGDSLTYAVATGPAHGTLSGTGSARTYTPTADYFGSDSFTFSVSDASATSAAATVSITIHPVVTIASVSPTSGPAAGGTTITVHGGSFATGVTVKLDGNLCSDVIVDSSTQLRCVTPAGVVGLADLTVTASSGGSTATLTGAFFYEGLEASVAVASPAEAAQDAPAVAIDGSGVLHVVWADDRQGSSTIYYRRSLDSGLTWTGETQLSSGFGTDSDPTIVACGSAVIVAWNDGDDGCVHLRRSPDGGSTWGLDQTLSGSGAYGARLAADGAHVAITWNLGGALEVARSTDAGSTWLPAETPVTTSAGMADVAVSGNLVLLAYEDITTSLIATLRRDEAGTWSGPVGVGSSGGPQWNPDLIASGDVMVCAWESNGQVWAAPGAVSTLGWQAPAFLGNGFGPRLASSTSGVFLAWSDTGAGNANLRRSVDSGVSWGSVIRVDEGTQSGVSPAVAASGSELLVGYRDAAAAPSLVRARYGSYAQ